MALINCKECGHSVSDSAKTCPNCGYDLKKRRKIVWIILLNYAHLLFWLTRFINFYGLESDEATKIIWIFVIVTIIMIAVIMAMFQEKKYPTNFS